MIKIRSIVNQLSILIAVLSLAACVMPKTSVDNLKNVAPGEILFIGRVMLDPPLTEADVQLENVINLSDAPLHKSIQLKASDVYYDLKGQSAYDYQDSIYMADGDYYYFTWKKDKPLNMLGVTFITRSTQTNLDTMTLSLNDGIRVNHSGKSRAVYVGDITFVRDEFFNINDIVVSQKDYKKAIKAFRKKFNSDWKVEQGKLSSAK